MSAHDALGDQFGEFKREHQANNKTAKMMVAEYPTNYAATPVSGGGFNGAVTVDPKRARERLQRTVTYQPPAERSVN